MVQVSGVVTHPDKSIPRGLGTSYVRFEPEELHDPKARAATGAIDPETGKFDLYTQMPGDGARPGKYKITFKIDTAYPPLPNAASSVVPIEYLVSDTTPLSADVNSANRHFEFEVPKRQAKKAKK